MNLLNLLICWCKGHDWTEWKHLPHDPGLIFPPGMSRRECRRCGDLDYQFPEPPEFCNSPWPHPDGGTVTIRKGGSCG